MTPTALLLLAALTAPSAQTADACRRIEPTPAQREARFSNAYAMGPFAMRSLSGATSCRFDRPGEGECVLSGPGLVHITMDGVHAWYEIDASRGARVEVSNGQATCHVLAASLRRR